MTRFLIRASFLALLIDPSLETQKPPPASFAERHKIESAANPADLTFVLRTKTAQKHFRPGETIPITLEFSSSATDKYQLDGATYDRSGRLRSEEFVMDRRDAVDPLVDYFGSGVMGGIGGGIRSKPVLNAEPYRVNLTLNDWFRFDNPGRYRMFLKSHRISRQRLTSEPGEGLVNIAPASNILEIEITGRDPAWEEAKLADLRAVLDPARRPPVKLADPFYFHTQTHDPKILEAANELGYLGTPGAVGLMMAITRRDLNDLDHFGLIGSPHRSLVIDELERYLQDPNTLIVVALIHIRTLFDYIAKYSPSPLPMYRWQLPGDDWTSLRAEAESRQEQFRTMVRRRAVELIPIVAKKSPQFREQCAETIAKLAPEEARAAGLLPPSDYGMTRSELIANFNTLAEKQQFSLLTEKWGMIRGPDMLPALRRLVTNALPPPAEGPYRFQVHGSLAEIALRHMQGYAPNEVTALLLEDLTLTEPRFAQFALCELPAQEVPEADEVLSQKLKSNRPSALPLIAKFGSPALQNQVRAAFEEREGWPCTEEESFLAYFVRVLPVEGPGGGKELLTRALAERERRGCFRMLLGRIARMIWNSVVEQQAVLTLNDPDPQAAADAARVLSRYGNASLEPLLWKRLEQWSAEWRGRVRDLDGNAITGVNPNREEERLGETLFSAIAEARAWYLDEERRGRLHALCIDDRCRERWSRSSAGEVHVQASKYGAQWDRGFQVQQYILATMKELQAKLAQFPANTAFRWCPKLDEPFETLLPEEAQDMYDDLAAFLASRSMHIEPYSTEACSPAKAQ